MGTSAFIGLTHGGQTITASRTQDGYPTALGVSTMTMVRDERDNLAALGDALMALPRLPWIWLDASSTDADVEAAARFDDVELGAKGDLRHFVREGAFPLYSDRSPDALSQADLSDSYGNFEYGYLIDLDEAALRIYGASLADDIGLRKTTIPFDELRRLADDDIEALCKVLEWRLNDPEDPEFAAAGRRSIARAIRMWRNQQSR
ncbi:MULTISPECIES: hypothetical protein [unclassified Microbacterium]|uniref:hypothetical protein n=1 Tax=unclassified Microbacterium TaxID=2609290 RepID=UPI002882F205|nr:MULTISPECIES: hypothetical protein [unclassified Microbacterium]